MTSPHRLVASASSARAAKSIAPSFEGEREINAMLNRGDVQVLRMIRNRYPRGATPHAIVAWAAGLDLMNPGRDCQEEADGYLLLVMHYAKLGDLDTALEYAREYHRLTGSRS